MTEPTSLAHARTFQLHKDLTGYGPAAEVVQTVFHLEGDCIAIAAPSPEVLARFLANPRRWNGLSRSHTGRFQKAFIFKTAHRVR